MLFQEILLFERTNVRQIEGSVERAFTWSEGRGCSLRRVDDGEEPGHVKRSPILVEDRGGDIAALLARFQRAAQEPDPDIRALVTARLRDYAARTAGWEKVHAGG